MDCPPSECFLRDRQVADRRPSRRDLGVDLHPTNFVVCFLSEEGKSRVVTFALTTAGLAAFRRQLRADDALVVEAGQTT
jgi:hypothetical protein